MFNIVFVRRDGGFYLFVIIEQYIRSLEIECSSLPNLSFYDRGSRGRGEGKGEEGR